jgi:protein involved in polysaccharide export with SLBB domain
MDGSMSHALRELSRCSRRAGVGTGRRISTRTLAWTFSFIAATAVFPPLSAPQSPPPAAEPQPLSTGMNTVTLRAGDAVRITVWRKPEFSGEFIVSSDGSIAHPLYREVRAGGVPLPALEERLRTFLQRFEEKPQFVVEPLLRIAVGGEVRLPNLYNLRPETSVAQAVALAGGPNERGRRDRVRLVRGDRETVVDLRNGGASLARGPVQSGDQIFVERERAVFRELIAPSMSILGGVAAMISLIFYARDNP